MIKVCKWCNKKFTAKKLNQEYCCKACGQEGKRKYQREYEANKKSKSKETEKKPKKKVNAITDIAIAARAAGMTYGEYVAKVLNADSYRVHREGGRDENKRK